MVTKKDYLDWLGSKNQEVRNKAFQSALIDVLEGGDVFGFYELMQVNPQLIEGNICWVIKPRPQLWPKFVAHCKEIYNPKDDITLNLMMELAGMITFYLPKNVDVAEAREFVENYAPEKKASNEMVMCLLVCILADRNWKTKILSLLKKYPLMDMAYWDYYIEHYNPLHDLDDEILRAVIKAPGGGYNAKIIFSLILEYGNSEENRNKIFGFVREDSSCLAALISDLSAIFKYDKYNRKMRLALVEIVLNLILEKKPELPPKVRSAFIDNLDEWLRLDLEKGMALLNQYEEIYPDDAENISAAYHKMFLRYMRLKNVELVGIVEDYDSSDDISQVLIKKVLEPQYLSGLAKVTQFKGYVILLTACLHDDLYGMVLPLFDAIDKSYGFYGDFFKALPQMEKVLHKRPELLFRVKDMLENVHFGYDRNEPTDADLWRYVKFCHDFGLDAKKLQPRYDERLTPIIRSYNQDLDILSRLDEKLNQ